MYTGIVQQVGRVRSIGTAENALKFEIGVARVFLDGLGIGDSIAIDGVCHTVVAMAEDAVRIDSGFETQRITTMADLRIGSEVNMERSAKLNQENGGHNVSGHVDGVAEIIRVETGENKRILRLSVPERMRRYIFDKGFVTVHGASLTVNNYDYDKGEFEVCLVPETLRKTNLAGFEAKGRLNIEIDRMGQILVDTIERTLARVLPNFQKK